MYAVEDRTQLYSKAGEALHVAQAMDVFISTICAIARDKFDLQLDESSFVVGEHRKTLGRLLNELKDLVTLDDSAIVEISAALEARNYIAHEFFNRNIEAFDSLESYERALLSMDKLLKKVVFGCAITTGFAQGLCQALNLPQSSILVRQDAPRQSQKKVE